MRGGASVTPQNKFQTTKDTSSGRPIYVPLGKGFAYMSGRFGEPRPATQYSPAHDHGGDDFAAAMGTPTFAVQDGTVVHSGYKNDGFGNSVVIQLKNGLYVLYGHLSANDVKEGTQVTAGQQVGKVGDTGACAPGAYHLHLQVMKDYATYSGKLNPDVILAVGSGTQQPGMTPARTAGISPTPLALPVNAIRLSDGSWLWGAQRFDAKGKAIGDAPAGVKPTNITGAEWNRRNGVGQPTQTAKATGTSQYPIRTNSMPITYTRRDIQSPNSTNNYGYDYLNVAKHPDHLAFVQALHRTAYQMGVPAVWLADIIDEETGWRLNSTNSSGHTGIIQFSEETVANLERLMGRKFPYSDPVAQFAWVKAYADEFKGGFKTVEDLAAHVFGGAPLYNRSAQGRASFIDGNRRSFPVYMQKLGAGAGRRYQTSYDPTTPAIHALYHPDCPTCNSLLAAGSFTDHYQGLT